MARIALACSLVLALMTAAAPVAVAKAPVPRPGTYEGTDDAGGVVAIEVDRRHRIVDVSVPGPVDCPYSPLPGYAGARFGGVGGTSIPVKGGRFAYRSRSGTIAGRVLADGSITGVVTAAIKPPMLECSHTWRFTVRRFRTSVAAPVVGTWRGTDALGGTVSFEVWPIQFQLASISIYGPWTACGGPALNGLAAHFGGGWQTAYDRSRRTGKVSIEQRFAGKLGVGGGANGPVVAAESAPGASVWSRFDGVIHGASASGTWHTRVTSDDGTIRCDSGPVSWTAAPAS